MHAKATDANTLDGIDANGFVQGAGDVTFRDSLLIQNQAITNWMSGAERNADLDAADDARDLGAA
jgi:hypothetical protein